MGSILLSLGTVNAFNRRGSNRWTFDELTNLIKSLRWVQTMNEREFFGPEISNQIFLLMEEKDF